MAIELAESLDLILAGYIDGSGLILRLMQLTRHKPKAEGTTLEQAASELVAKQAEYREVITNNEWARLTTKLSCFILKKNPDLEFQRLDLSTLFNHSSSEKIG